MATGTVQGDPEPRRPDGPHAVGDVLDSILLVDDAAFRVDSVVAVEARGDALAEGWIGQQVAGQLIGDEAVVRKVAVERVDHPVPPAPHRALGIVVVPVRVGIASHVHPVHRHSLPVARRGQRPIHRRFEGGLSSTGSIPAKCHDLRPAGRQPVQVEGHPPQPDRGPSLRRRGQAFGVQPPEDERIYRTPDP